MDLTTPGWIIQSSDCLRRYWLSTAYLMLDGPDHTRLNHTVKWLFEKVLAVNMPLFWNSVQILSVARTRREHWSYKFCRTFPFLRSRSFQHVMPLNGMVSIHITVHLHIIPFVSGNYLIALVVLYRTNIDVCTWSHSHLLFDIGPNIRFNLDNGNFFVNSCYGTTGKKCER